MIAVLRTVPVSPPTPPGRCVRPAPILTKRLDDTRTTTLPKREGMPSCEEAGPGVLRLVPSVRHEPMHFTDLIEAAHHGGNEQNEGDDEETLRREGTYGAVKSR